MISTAARVPANTARAVNRRIHRDMKARLAYFAGRPDEIEERLAELDQEWGIERTIEANAATLAFIGVVLGATTHRRWLALPTLVTGFLFQHAIQGWCPPVPILRRFGFRTADEINCERYALKALRGDFAEMAASEDRLSAALRAVSG